MCSGMFNGIAMNMAWVRNQKGKLGLEVKLIYILE
jgi:hypothetical protein